jgi:hypothetical protein
VTNTTHFLFTFKQLAKIPENPQTTGEEKSGRVYRNLAAVGYLCTPYG